MRGIRTLRSIVVLAAACVLALSACAAPAATGAFHEIGTEGERFRERPAP